MDKSNLPSLYSPLSRFIILPKRTTLGAKVGIIEAESGRRYL